MYGGLFEVCGARIRNDRPLRTYPEFFVKRMYGLFKFMALQKFQNDYERNYADNSRAETLHKNPGDFIDIENIVK